MSLSARRRTGDVGFKSHINNGYRRIESCSFGSSVGDLRSPRIKASLINLRGAFFMPRIYRVTQCNSVTRRAKLLKTVFIFKIVVYCVT